MIAANRSREVANDIILSKYRSIIDNLVLEIREACSEGKMSTLLPLNQIPYEIWSYVQSYGYEIREVGKLSFRVKW